MSTQPQSIDAAELRRRLDAPDAPAVVDTRLPEHCADGHIPGALLGTSDTILERAPELLPDREAEIVLYTGDRTCRRAMGSAERLRSLGYTRVLEYPEGLAGWYPTEP
ncbi:MAG: rhodanese-like domain-containing protein [Candidatus Limnocylindria bacterium]